MKMAKIITLASVAVAFLFLSHEAPAQYYIKKKKEVPQTETPVQSELPIPPVTQGISPAPAMAEVKMPPCTKEDLKSLREINDGLKAIEKEPDGLNGDSKKMFDFLEKPENVAKMAELFMRCGEHP